MLYSNDYIEDLYQNIARITKFDDGGVASLENLKRNPRWKGVNLQGKCENGDLLGDALLKLAAEYENSLIEDFLLNNGCGPLQQKQTVAVIKEKKEQITPEVEENVAGPSNSNEVGSNNPMDSQPAIPCTKIEEILARDPNIKPEDFYKELKEEMKTDIKIFDLFVDAVRSGGAGISNNRDIFLKAVELLGNSCVKINGLKNTTSNNLLDIAAVNKQADVIKILLDSGKFNEEERLNALRLAIIQGNAREVKTFLGYVSIEVALKFAMDSNQEAITNMLLEYNEQEVLNVEENGTGSSSSNENVGTKPTVTTTEQKTDTDDFKDAQFSVPNETKSKESSKDFYRSLKKDFAGISVTLLLIIPAIFVPLPGNIVFGVLATCVAIGTLIHALNSTLPNYNEMKNSRVEHIDPKRLSTQG